jgi:hypothetical protein
VHTIGDDPESAGWKGTGRTAGYIVVLYDSTYANSYLLPVADEERFSRRSPMDRRFELSMQNPRQVRLCYNARRRALFIFDACPIPAALDGNKGNMER